MNQLVKKEVILSPDLSDQESRIVKAATAPKVREGNKISLATVIDGVVASCMVTIGTDTKKYDENQLFLIKKEIVNDIYTSFSGLTYEEIRLACYLGARGAYKASPDEVVFFSVAKVFQWLKGYITESKREAMSKQARFEQDRYVKKEPTPEELKAFEEMFIRDCIIKPFRVYKETGQYTFDNRGNVIYNRLDKLGVIPFSKEKKKEIMEKAKNRVIAQLESNISHDTKRKYKEIEEKSGEGHELVKSEAKDIALKMFIDELIVDGMDLEDFIELRRNDQNES